jgi:aryl-alcohol dehydrogenase-like predicted oxidoreductase
MRSSIMPSRGANFIDTAEMYPEPPCSETQGRTQIYLGNWLKRQQRDKLIVATKITAPGRGFAWVRGGPTAIDQRYAKVNAPEAVAAYAELARGVGVSPVGLALAFVRSRWFTASTIIGATTLAPLKENLDTTEIVLDEETVAQIDEIHRRYPNPAL